MPSRETETSVGATEPRRGHMDTWPLKYEYFHKLNADMQVRAVCPRACAHALRPEITL